MTEDQDPTVYYQKTAGAVPSCYHTDPDCGHIRVEDPREDKLSNLVWDLQECKWCAGTADNKTTDRDHYDSLIEAAEAEEAHQ